MAEIIEFKKPKPDPRKTGFGKRDREADKYVRLIKLNGAVVPADLIARATISLAEAVAFDKVGAHKMSAAEELLLRILEQQTGVTEYKDERQSRPGDKGTPTEGSDSGE